MPPPYHRTLTIADQTFDFPHFEPFQLEIASHAVGRPLHIHVLFMTHCFSEGFEPAVHAQSAFTFPGTVTAKLCGMAICGRADLTVCPGPPRAATRSQSGDTGS